MLAPTCHNVLSQLLHHLRRHDAGAIQAVLRAARPAEAASALRAFDSWHRALFLELAPPAAAAAIFRELPLRHQAEVLRQIEAPGCAAILARLERDERQLALSLVNDRSRERIRRFLPAEAELAS